MAKSVTERPIMPNLAEAIQGVSNVLVVDDSRSQCAILTAYLERWGYRVFHASCGEEALQICRTRNMDVVISDWMMPGMSGLEFCQEFRALEESRYGYFILLTSRSGKDEIARGLDVGADDFLAKPVSANELRARIRAGARLIEMQRTLANQNRIVSDTLSQIQALYDALDRDLIEARGLQQSLVRERQHDFGTARVSLLFQPQGHVGGDLVGVFSVAAETIGLFSIDVSGHGVASALMTARLAAYFSSTGARLGMSADAENHKYGHILSPSHLARQLNKLLLDELDTSLYFTMSLGYLNLSSGEMSMVQCGHPHATIQRASGVIEFCGQGGLPIGLFHDAIWEDFQVQLGPGDRLLMLSDGITECPNPNGEMLGEVGLVAAFNRYANLHNSEFLDALSRDVEAFSVGRRPSDDISAALLEYQGQRERENESSREPSPLFASR